MTTKPDWHKHLKSLNRVQIGKFWLEELSLTNFSSSINNYQEIMGFISKDKMASLSSKINHHIFHRSINYLTFLNNHDHLAKFLWSYIIIFFFSPSLFSSIFVSSPFSAPPSLQHSPFLLLYCRGENSCLPSFD